jgi:hypothetical protein
MADQEENAVRGGAEPARRKWKTRLATDEDIQKYFGSGNLLIGSRVRPKPSEPTEEESRGTDRER